MTYSTLRILLFLASLALLPPLARADQPPGVDSPGARAVVVDDHAAPPRAPRVRAAVDLAGGFFDLPRRGRVGGGLTAVGRLGGQITEGFAVVYQVGLGFLHVTADGGDTSDSYFGGVVQSSVLLVATLGDIVDLGAGPAGDVYFWGGPFGSEPSFAPGGHVRLAAHVLAFARRGPALTLGWDQRVTAYTGISSAGPAIAGQLGVGVEWY
jgi:hypothetical protein